MYEWIKAVHVIGFLTWTGSLVACLSLLRRHGDANEESVRLLTEIERKFALSMDIGAAIAIVAGVYLAVGFSPINWFDAKIFGPWLHIKSTLVVLLIAVHGFTRMKFGKIRKGEDTTMPSIVLPVTFALLTAIVIIATVKPLMK